VYTSAFPVNARFYPPTSLSWLVAALYIPTVDCDFVLPAVRVGISVWQLNCTLRE